MSYGQNKTIYILYGSLWGPYKAHVQNGVSVSYMDAVFKLVAHKESIISTSLSHSFSKGGLLQLSGYIGVGSNFTLGGGGGAELVGCRRQLKTRGIWGHAPQDNLRFQAF